MVTVQKLLIALLLLASSQCITHKTESFNENWLREVDTRRERRPAQEDVGEPLFLTPLIEAGNLSYARNASLVGDLGIEGIPSYSGYFTVNPEQNGNIFFWYFPAQTNSEDAPVILWLQGGPGFSSLLGLFWENGPFKVSEDMGLTTNPYSWHLQHNVIYIDNPVGTGYSYADRDGYATNQVEVARDLYASLIQFFTLFPELQDNDFFVTGESFAGKYVPAICYTIHENNPTADLKINLKGLAIGNGFSDPVSVLNYSEFLYQVGLVDVNATAEINGTEQEGKDAIADEKWMFAYNAWDYTLTLIYYYSGYKDPYNFLAVERPPESKYFIDYVQQSEVRKAIHVGNQTFMDGLSAVYFGFLMDFMQSVKPWVEVLVENYRVMYFSGQLDIMVAYPQSESYYQSLNFSAAEEYRSANRSIWYVGDDLAGYVKTAGNFTEVLVRNAGHMVSADQPVWMLDLITKFIANEPIVTTDNSKEIYNA